MRGATTLDHKLKDTLKNQYAALHFFSDPDLQNIDSCKEFKSKISSFIKMESNSIFSVHDVYGVKLLFRLILNFIYLNDRKVRHSFKDVTNCMCD